MVTRCWFARGVEGASEGGGRTYGARAHPDARMAIPRIECILRTVYEYEPTSDKNTAV